MTTPQRPRPVQPLLRVVDLVKGFPVRGGILQRVKGVVRAVDGVSFEVGVGETLGLVGESGCGKTTVGRTVLRLEEPTSGSVFFEGRDLSEVKGRELRALRRQMQIVFQDPFGSLNPRMRVRDIVGEGPRIHGMASGSRLEQRVTELLDSVGLAPDSGDRFPHEFSGGQRQRIGIARALSVEPRFIVCDEAVSALDVSVQAQVLNLLMELRDQHELSYLFISHDLAVVRHVSHRVAVMYLGEIVETAEVQELFRTPRHPYTQALMAAIPVADPERPRKRILLEGELPDPADPPPGCRFHSRCPVAEARCSVESPPLQQPSPTHSYRCIH